MSMPVAQVIHRAIFSLIVAVCLGEIATSGILVSNYNQLEDADLFTSLATRTRYLLFCGIWTTLFSLVYLVGLNSAPGHLAFSVASHLLWLGVTIVLFVSGSAALTSEIRDQNFPHQQRLEILQGFAWADCILLVVALLLILAIGVSRRNGLSANLLGGP